MKKICFVRRTRVTGQSYMYICLNQLSKNDSALYFMGDALRTTLYNQRFFVGDLKNLSDDCCGLLLMCYVCPCHHRNDQFLLAGKII